MQGYSNFQILITNILRLHNLIPKSLGCDKIVVGDVMEHVNKVVPIKFLGYFIKKKTLKTRFNLKL